MNDQNDTTRAVTAQVSSQIRASAEFDEQQAARLRTRTAEGWETAAAVKRQVADILDGRPVHAGQVTEAGDLGMRVGPLPLPAPPGDAPLEAFEAHRALLERVYEIALRQMQRTKAEITRRRSTLDTGQLPPEYLPGPDPLTASPAEASGVHPVLVAAGELPEGVEPHTSAVPDASAECRNGCGSPLIRVNGEWLHAVTMDAECRPGAEQVADPVRVVLRDPAPQVDGEPAPPPPAQETRPDPGPRGAGRDGGRLFRGALKRRKPEQDHPSPWDEQAGRQEPPVEYLAYVGKRVLIRAKDGTRSRGTLLKAGRERLVLEPCEMGPPVVAAKDVDGVFPYRVGRSDAGIWQPTPQGRVNMLAPSDAPMPYPDQPAMRMLPASGPGADPVPPPVEADAPQAAGHAAGEGGDRVG